MNKENPLKLRKGQKCWLCKKEIKKGAWCWNGHYWHGKCKDKDSAKRIKNYLPQSFDLEKLKEALKKELKVAEINS